jgi:hypothetical protein
MSRSPILGLELAAQLTFEMGEAFFVKYAVRNSFGLTLSGIHWYCQLGTVVRRLQAYLPTRIHVGDIPAWVT